MPSETAAMPTRPTSLIVLRAIVMPSPSFPSRFSRATRQSRKINSPVSAPRSPSLCSWRPALNPGVPFSTTNALIPFGPSPVLATVTTASLRWQLVMKHLRPFNT